MRTLKISLLVFILSITVPAQEGWFWQNPLPQGNELRSICFVEGNIGTAVGSFGTIIRTTDGGDTWVVQNSNTTSLLFDVSFSDSDHGTTVGLSGTIRRTADGGNNWFNQTSGTTEVLHAVHFISQNYGIAVGDNATILKTTNGGANWNELTSPSYVDFYSVFFVDSSIGFIVGQSGRVLKTTDGGTNWVIQTIANGSHLRAVQFIDLNNGIIVGDAGKFLQTSDGGINWIAKPLPDLNNFLLSAYFTDRYNGTAVGYNNSTYDGVVIHTTDGGTTWSYNYYPFIYLWGVSFSNISNGIVVGDIGEIFRTTDGGFNWFDQFNCVTNNLNGISILDENNAIVVGRGGTILKTINAGVDWILQTIGGGSLEDIFFNNFINGTIVGNGIIIKTVDGGINWSIQYNEPGLLLGVFFTDLNNGTAVGAYGKILTTTNGGNDWYTQTSGTNKFLHDVWFLNEQNGIIVCGESYGGSGIILKTTNGGNNWNSVWSGSSRLRSVYFVNENFGIAVGQYGKILRTTDSGYTWSNRSSGTNFELNGVAFTDVNHGTVVGGSIYDLGGIILRTTNGGLSWSTQFVTNYEHELYGVGFLSTNIGYVVGQKGALLKTVNGGIITNLEEYSDDNSEEVKYFLLNQNYPNPFNPTTSLQFAIGSRQFVTLKIYDLLGREVVTLVNEEKPAGKYEVEFNATNFPTGIYFYQLKAGQFSETKKMLLLK